MQEVTPKEIVLKSLRDSLIEPMDNPFADFDFGKKVFADGNDDIVAFANNFVNVGGQFCYCEGYRSFAENLKGLYDFQGWNGLFCIDDFIKGKISDCGIDVVSDADKMLETKAVLTPCDFLIARSGSIVLSSATLKGRKQHVYPEDHIVYAYMSQLVPDLKTALKNFAAKGNLPSMIVTITGGSRTADIEKTIVRPAHGPCNVYLFLIEE